ncbi:Neuroligin-4, X-linked [Ooceraea biroi]|uniref:Neuroligin-4, X-linked n=1 Tax=Ooceraea biroi TaxID=2015173 RepID=A0A026WFW0_OOCBI|nr:Neuroligin-4, X-linked [Ooceraea biroi]
MSRMLRLELVGLLLLTCTQILTEHRDFHEPRNQYGYHRFPDFQERMTREVRVKEGRLRGMVIQPMTNYNLQLVDVFLGIPYAEPPVGSFRFSPPRSPQPWRGVRQSQEFAPVCPQVLPNLQDEVKPGRYEYLERHLPYLRNQSEDCLYLNIYAPHQAEGQRNLKKYPVMMFIHGESYEWNSGNPYDGTILAAYGNVVFVTINFRLGILGFLRPGIRDDTASNFGLLDQIAALLWLRENIAEFGGNPNSVTLVGHGTGAIFANLLLISPVANRKDLFKRAILMSGSAMSADAIGKAPLQITKQVAHALNCPTTSDSELALCLRNQDVDTLLHVKIHKPKYVPAYAPLIDRAVIPDKPLNLMENVQTFGRFDLMYGVTESEKFHILPPVALLHGMLDGQRDEVLRDHAKATHELEPELILSKVLEQYGDFSSGFTKDYATMNRDLVLEAISDSGIVAPLIMTANLHSRANPKSYMYVFSHPKAMQDYSGQQRQHTVHGEELPYVLGIPLDGSKYDLRGRYDVRETLLSEAIMNWWCSFAYIGSPYIAKRYPYLTNAFKEWGRYEIEWPEYDPVNQTYFNLTIPPNVGAHYRSVEMQFWNEDLPNLLRHPNKDIPGPTRPRGPRPQILDFADGIGRYANGTANRKYETYSARYTTPSSITDSSTDKTPFSIMFTTSTSIAQEPTVEPSTLKNQSMMMMVIVFSVLFILINLTIFLYIYHKRHNVKGKEKSLKRRASEKREDSVKRSKTDKHDNHYSQLGYKSDSKPDLNDVIKNDKAYDNNSNFGRRSKLSRQNSSSTIDTHIKVREWIQQEIVHRCSPRFLRKTRETLQKEHQEKLSKQEEQQRMEEEALKERKEEPIYDESPALVVRPGKKPKTPKVSVAIDATPATRTNSILNQVPIELVRGIELVNEYEPSPDQLAPQVVVIEHHHSRSDPLPMENVLKMMKPNFSTPRIYESDSGSANSLYAKINPKLKSRLPRLGSGATAEAPLPESKCENLLDEEIYMKTGLTTFGTGDVNVTCREPTVERECISPEEALKTIKRRNYPKVLPDIEKRRSLPAPNSLFVPKQHANSLKDYKSGNRVNLFSNQPPLPPPRMFGPSKSLERSAFFIEENESQCEGEPITTNLHVGPLLKKQDSRNNSDPNMIDSLEGNKIVQGGGSADAIYANPKCPLHGNQYPYPPTSQSVDEDIGRSAGLLEVGNPNWYKAVVGDTQAMMTSTTSEPHIVISRDERQPVLGTGVPTVEPKIAITPRVFNPRQANQNVSPTALFDDKIAHELKTAETIRAGGSLEEVTSGGSLIRETERREPRIIITAREPKNCAPASSLKQPKIIIKPTTATLPRNRDQRNIPKVSAIPSPEQQNCQNSERDRALEQRERPSLREKPRVTRIPSFSRRREDVGIEKPSYAEKTEIVQRVEAAPSKITNAPSMPDAKSGIPTPTAPVTPKSEKTPSTDSSSASNGNSSNSNTGTIKRKPACKK